MGTARVPKSRGKGDGKAKGGRGDGGAKDKGKPASSGRHIRVRVGGCPHLYNFSPNICPSFPHLRENMLFQRFPSLGALKARGRLIYSVLLSVRCPWGLPRMARSQRPAAPAGAPWIT